MEFVLWIGLAIAVGFWANSKGRDGFGWGLLSLLISPLLGAIIVYFVSLKDQEKAAAKELSEREVAEKEAKRVDAEAKEHLHQTTVSGAEFARELEKLFALKENGLLTDAEFSEKKGAQVFQLATKRPRESPPDFLAALIPMVKRAILTPEEIAEIKKYVF